MEVNWLDIVLLGVMLFWMYRYYRLLTLYEEEQDDRQTLDHFLALLADGYAKIYRVGESYRIERTRNGEQRRSQGTAEG